MPPNDAADQPDPLGWLGYDAAREAARLQSGCDESVTVATEVFEGGRSAVVVRGHFDHLGGSMGTVAGRRIAAAYDLATSQRLPVVLRTASGGARMQEGMASLVQMAATTVAARQHAAAGLLQIAMLGHPTTGGVFASHANLADILLAEAGATIGFAGPRVAEAMTGGALPVHSHTAQGARAAGLADAVVSPGDTAAVSAVLDWAASAEQARSDGWARVAAAPSRPADDLEATLPEDVDAWQAVLAARAPDRARASVWLDGIDVAFELHGDRSGGDDPTIRVALARLAGAPIVVVALDRDVDEARVGPSGLRKAWRGFALADRLGVPLVTLIDTLGADASASAEAGGIAHHIATTFAKLLEVTVPTVALVTGEGGSGGALALAVADRLLMLEHATFSVIAPEGAAAILHRDPFRAPDVAAQLRPDAGTLLRLGIADAVVDESGDPVVNGWDVVTHALRELAEQDPVGRRDRRLGKWRTAPVLP